jgi:hypothetical protein
MFPMARKPNKINEVGRRYGIKFSYYSAMGFYELLFKRKPKGIQAQENGGVPAEDIQKTAVSHVAFEAFAGLGTVVVDFAGIGIVSFFKKDTAFVIRVNHIDRSALLGLFDQFGQGLFPELGKGGFHPDMAAHLADKIHFIGFEGYLPVAFTAGAALAAFVKNGIQGSGIQRRGICHGCPFKTSRILWRDDWQ